MRPKPSEYRPSSFNSFKSGWAADSPEEALERIRRTPPVPFICFSCRSKDEVRTFIPQNFFFRINTAYDGPAHECYTDFYNEDDYPPDRGEDLD
jgi:hypothetical protein